MKNHGFSLIELILVLVLVAILAATVMPYIFSGESAVSASVVAAKVKNDIRYAQALAMGRHKLSSPTAAGTTNPVFAFQMRFNFNDAANCPGTTNYSIVNDADFDGTWGEDSTESAKLPSTGAAYFCVQLDSGDYTDITAGYGGLTDGILQFDTFGRPYDYVIATTTATLLTAAATVTLTKGSASSTITITADTGLVTGP